MILRAISDAGSKQSKLRLDVAKWLISPDYETVCDLAAVSGDELKKSIEEILKNNYPVSFIMANQLKKKLSKVVNSEDV